MWASAARGLSSVDVEEGGGVGTAGTVFAQSASREDDRTVLCKTKSIDGTKRNTNPKNNRNPNTNPNPKLTLILTLFSCFMFFRALSHDLHTSPASHVQ